MNKNILLFCGRWTVGGVENLHVVLANEFVRQGVNVAIVLCKCDNSALLKKLDPAINVYDLDDMRLSSKSCRRLSAILKENSIDVIINSWCLPFKVTWFLKRASKPLGVKIVSVHHSQPDVNARILNAHVNIQKVLYRFFTSLSLRLVYRFSDGYVLVSERYMDVMARLIGRKKAEKVHVLSYPITVLPAKETHKENVILFVGRLDETHKKVSRVIDVWKRLEDMLPDWHLDIVGDGPSRSDYEIAASGCKRIRFKGFQSHIDYSVAKIFVMTSDFEGMPLSLTEAMSNGCVPVILGSYLSVYDIIDGTNGIILPVPFDAKRMANIIYELAMDNDLLVALSKHARAVNDAYSMQHVSSKWLECINSL